MKKGLLDRVKFSFVCPMDWENFAGEGAGRFCEKCQHTVTDLSEMTREAAESFLSTAKGRTCVRIMRDAEGSVVSKGCPRETAVKKKVKTALSLAAAAGAGLALASCAKEPVMMGGIMCPSDMQSSK